MVEIRVVLRRRWPIVAVGGLVVLAALSGASLGFFLRLDLPDIRALQDYTPPVMTVVLARDGSNVAAFAEEKRMLVDYGDIPPHFRAALIATEDSAFLEHTGFDFKGALRALWRDIRTRSLEEGASTLTMQLAGNLFLDRRQKTIRRKLQEVVLAIEIERHYTKEEILHMYCNQVHWGHGLYGLGAAARYYFGKPARDLTLAESSVLVGILPRPARYSPFRNLDLALKRRDYVLRRMVAEGMISAERAAEAREEPLHLSSDHRLEETTAPYFVEEVRRWLKDGYGSSSLYREGLAVHSTLDPQLQEIANHAVDRGLRELDKRQGWRGVQARIPDGADPLEWSAPDWAAGIEPEGVYDGVVVEVERERARVRVGEYGGSLGPKQYGWTGVKVATDLFRVGDLVRVRLLSAGEAGAATFSLEQEPEAEAALVALDPASGAIRALVGGFGFERSEFDRAIQAKRQTGSAFKPLVFSAALRTGWTLADTLLDSPTVFIDRRNPDPYQPENYSLKYYHTVTLRTAMEKSANIATVKLLNRIGYDAVIDTARRLGISSELKPFPSLALGSFEISLLELTSAYGTFANQGVRVEPHLVEEVRNRQDTLVTRVEPEVRDAVRPQIAYLMNRVLSGVISDGTGRAAKGLGGNVAGKTGTTDNNTDAWFVGYTPDLAVGVWVGFDEPRSLGSRETGAMAALPIWREFMERALALLPPRDFPLPPGLTIVSVDRRTGLKANRSAGCAPVISEVFIKGTEPTAYCSEHEHARLDLPYPFQRYALNEQGALVIPSPDLHRLLDAEVDVYLLEATGILERHTPEGRRAMPVEVVPGTKEDPLPEWLIERFDPAEWTGVDGRAAEIIWLN